jgi:hypothetical protein
MTMMMMTMLMSCLILWCTVFKGAGYVALLIYIHFHFHSHSSFFILTPPRRVMTSTQI